MRIKYLIVALLFVVTAGVWAQPAGSPVAKYGQLKVSGTKIKDKNNNDVQLRGMSFFWGHVSHEGNMYWNADVLDWLARDWMVDVVRIPLGAYDKNQSTDFFWKNNAIAQRRATETLIEAAIERGIYVILDWHAHHMTNEAKDSAKAVFKDFATKYGNKPNMIYEIYNEPINDSWSNIKNYANEVIPVIRNKDANNIILVGTPFYSQNLDQVVNNTVTGSNVGYVLHFYAMTHGSDLQGKAQALLNAGQMVFVTEWGTTNAQGGNDGQWGQSQSDGWLNWMDERKISWANWSITHKNEASAVLVNNIGANKYFGGWEQSDLKPSGQYVRCKLRTAAGKNCNYDTPKSSSSAAVASSSSAEAGVGGLHILPGRIEPENYTLALGAKPGNASTDPTEITEKKQSLGFITHNTWAEYDVYISQTADYDITTSTAGLNDGGSATISIDRQTLGSFPVIKNGKTTVWNMNTDIAKINLPKGRHTMRLDFSSSIGRGLPNISWIEFTSPGVIPEDPNPVASPLLSSQISWNYQPGALTVQNQSEQGVEVVLSNIMGAQVARFSVAPGTQRLDLSSWSGLHIVSVKQGAKLLQARKVVLAQ